jgi:hypothetical protein
MPTAESEPLDMGEAILRSLADAMARHDRVAFLAFYCALCPEVHGRLTAVTDAARVRVLTESVFLHAWHLAPWRTPGTPIRRWLAGLVERHAGLDSSPQRLACVSEEFRRLLCRADADAEALRAARRTEPL